MDLLNKRVTLLPAVFLQMLLSAIACGAELPASTRATVLEGRLLINERPTFFVGFAPGPPIDLKAPDGTDGWEKLAAGGLTVVRGGVSNEGWTPAAMGTFASYLDRAASRGVYVWPFLRELVELRTPADHERLTAFIERFKSHPAVLMWKSADEPEWGRKPVEPLRRAYALIRELDPNHPVWFCHAPRGSLETLRPYNAACDVLSIDIYPISDPPGKHSLEANKGLSMVGDFTRRTVELAGRDKMPFMVLQACWSGVLPAHNPRNRLMFPTLRQERYMLYQAIICGARSVSFFGMTLGLTGRDAELGWNWTFWRNVLEPLLAEIKPGSPLYPALIAPDAPHPVTFTGAPRIEVRCRQVADHLFIMAAAREGAAESVRFAGLPDGPVTVLYENRSLTAAHGEITDTFAEHDVHLYRVNLPPASGPSPSTAPAELSN